MRYLFSLLIICALTLTTSLEAKAATRVKITSKNRRNFLVLSRNSREQVICFHQRNSIASGLGHRSSHKLVTWTSFRTLIGEARRNRHLSSWQKRRKVTSLQKSKRRFDTACNKALHPSTPTPTPTTVPTPIPTNTTTPTPLPTGTATATLTPTPTPSPTPTPIPGSGKLELSSALLHFGEVNLGDSASKSLVLKNSGTASLTVTGISFGGDEATAFTVEGTVLPLLLSENQQTSITLKFTPSHEGVVNSTVAIGVDASSSSAPLTVDGKGLPSTQNVAINFEEVTTISDVTESDFSRPTSAAWGPDGKLYVVSTLGEIIIYSFDDQYKVTDKRIVRTMGSVYNHNVLGIAFNPKDPPNPVRIYVTHCELFADNSGGQCPDQAVSYSGQVSVLTGPDFDQIEPLVTGIPVSNFDDGVNSLEFDDTGNMYICVAAMTNAGVPDCRMGGLPENPLSGAVLKASIGRADFDGHIRYRNRDTNNIDMDERDGDKVDLVAGSGVSVFSAGFRNAFDVLWTTKRHLYATDNGPGLGYGNASTSATTEGPNPAEQDEVVLLEKDAYYGAPNRNRGLVDDRQNVYHPPEETGIPGVYTEPLAIVTSSSNGLTEYRATTFNSKMRGDLLVKRFSFNGTGDLYRVHMSADGQRVDQLSIINSDFSGVDVITAPGGALIVTDLRSGEPNTSTIHVLTPVDPSIQGMKALDIHPWRGPASGGTPFIIGGQGFSNDARVFIGGIEAQVSSVSSTRIRGIIPRSTASTDTLLEVKVVSGSSTSVIPEAYRYLTE